MQNEYTKSKWTKKRNGKGWKECKAFRKGRGNKVEENGINKSLQRKLKGETEKRMTNKAQWDGKNKVIWAGKGSNSKKNVGTKIFL